MTKRTLVWFRRDLRLADNPALTAALAAGGQVVPCYVFDEKEDNPGAAARWWLHHSLKALDKSLRARGNRLHILSGDTLEQLIKLAERSNCTGLYFNRRYYPGAGSLETKLNSLSQKTALEYKRFPGNLLLEPEQVINNAGLPFRVFTPFWRACRQHYREKNPLPTPRKIPAPKALPKSLSVQDLGLLPQSPNWAEHWPNLWTPGEPGAQAALKKYLAGPITAYVQGRDCPAEPVTSRLSPHLSHGEISPRQIWSAARKLSLAKPESEAAVEKFLSELGWREFSYHLLFHFSDIPDRAFRREFNSFPWQTDRRLLESWQNGDTGYPLVDAGMRELWHTGYMHNRVRMIAASFLTKHLLQPWQHGQAWFWDTLVDADLANNACSWQWVAGSGADAAPYFRIFNPVLQGEKFDTTGRYVRKWIPALKQLPDKYVHCPWKAPVDILSAAEVVLGENYPSPIVEHSLARQRALDAYKNLKRRDDQSA